MLPHTTHDDGGQAEVLLALGKPCDLSSSLRAQTLIAHIAAADG